TLQQVGSNEVQTITFVSTGALAGSYQLSFNGQTTSTLAFGSTPSQVQSALQGLSSIGSGNITVLGQTPAAAAGTYIMTAVFTGVLAGTDLGQIYLNTTNLTGFTAATTVVSTIAPGQNRAVMTTQQGGAAPSNGQVFSAATNGTSYTLTFEGETTTVLPAA